MPDIPRIQIEQQTARIGIQTTNARVEVNTSPRPKMRIVTERPQMEVERKAPAFKVETQRLRGERPVLTRNQNAPARVAPRAKTLRPGADITLEAESLAPDTTAINAHALEMNKAINDYATSVDTESLHGNMPSIEWEAGYINITWSNAQMQIEWDQADYMPSFSVEPHSVEIFLREKPYIKITISDEVINAMYGPQMDEQV
ncbi:MAG: DUF6470 family protein [Clostridiales bacterium]|nr:DUF6470 family protein [Clostridiales bacterium]